MLSGEPWITYTNVWSHAFLLFLKKLAIMPFFFALTATEDRQQSLSARMQCRPELVLHNAGLATSTHEYEHGHTLRAVTVTVSVTVIVPPSIHNWTGR